MGMYYVMRASVTSRRVRHVGSLRTFDTDDIHHDHLVSGPERHATVLTPATATRSRFSFSPQR